MRLYMASQDADGQLTARSIASAKAHGNDVRFRPLLSYWFFKEAGPLTAYLDRFGEHGAFADSGAFSAFAAGATIDLDAYAAWLKQHGERFAVYANLDVIGNPQATWDNQRRLEDRGLTPLPVFHTGESFDWLERYCETYPYIALGGMVPYVGRTGLLRWILKCFQIAGERAVFHGFGVSGWEVLKSFRWHSCDSSSWCAGPRWGWLYAFDRTGFTHVDIGNPRDCAKKGSLLSSYGYRPSEFSDRASVPPELAMGFLLESFARAERLATALHGDPPIPPARTEAGRWLRNFVAGA